MSRSLIAARYLLATHGLGQEQKIELDAIISACFSHHADPGDMICLEGAPAQDLYFLLEGRVQVRTRDYLGVEQDLAVLHAPTMFGHMGLIDGSVRSASCVALDRARVNIMNHEQYQRIVDDPGPEGDMFRRLLLAAMSRQLSQGNTALQRLLTQDEQDDPTRALGRITGTFEGWEQRR